MLLDGSETTHRRLGRAVKLEPTDEAHRFVHAGAPWLRGPNWSATVEVRASWGTTLSTKPFVLAPSL